MNNKPQQRKNQRKHKVDRDYVGRKLREIVLKCGWKILDGYGREYFVHPRDGLISAPTYGKLHILTPTPNGEGYPTVKLKDLMASTTRRAFTGSSERYLFLISTKSPLSITSITTRRTTAAKI